MIPSDALEHMDEKIQILKQTALELKDYGDQQDPTVPALSKNLDRILASIKMLELNISDCLDVASIS